MLTTMVQDDDGSRWPTAVHDIRALSHHSRLGLVYSVTEAAAGISPAAVLVNNNNNNAFNSLHHHDILLSVFNRLSELYAYCHSAYGQPSILFHGLYIISSEDGPQEGDPIGPLLFCNTVQPLLESLQSDLRLGFLDDFKLGGTS